MSSFRVVCVAVAGLSLPMAAAGDVINFDDLASGIEVTNQYPSAIFSTIDGQENMTHGFNNGGNSPPNILCTAAAGAVNCLKPTFVDFPNPVDGLTFLAVEPNEFGVVATISVFQNGNHTDDVDLIGLAANPGEVQLGNKVVDLSGYSNITRIELAGPDGGDLDNAYGGGGIGWDDFSFTPVPGPGSGALLAAGGVIAFVRRRRA